MSRRSAVHVCVLQIELELPGSRSLKEKRSALKSLLIAVQREFACSAAEIDLLDDPARSVLACAVVSNDGPHTQRVLQRIPAWIEGHRPDLSVVDHELEVR